MFGLVRVLLEESLLVRRFLQTPPYPRLMAYPLEPIIAPIVTASDDSGCETMGDPHVVHLARLEAGGHRTAQLDGVAFPTSRECDSHAHGQKDGETREGEPVRA
jgi:hypothetical protein